MHPSVWTNWRRRNCKHRSYFPLKVSSDKQAGVMSPCGGHGALCFLASFCATSAILSREPFFLFCEYSDTSQERCYWSCWDPIRLHESKRRCFLKAKQTVSMPTDQLKFWSFGKWLIPKLRYSWSFGDNDDRRQVGRGGDGVTVDAMRAFASWRWRRRCPHVPNIGRLQVSRTPVCLLGTCVCHSNLSL